MTNWTRRALLKTGLVASATTVVGGPSGFSSTANVATAEPGPIGAKSALASTPAREKLLLDFGWRFQLGNADDPAKDFDFGKEARERTYAKSGQVAALAELKFDDSGWRSLDLPHDWVVELPFNSVKPLPEQGGKSIGREYPATSVGWYRRTFDIPAADSGRRISVLFDGVFRAADVFFNGHYLGHNFSGYAPFSFDVTDWVNFGEKNVLVVRVDATLGEGWFYEGAGLYRHVWLTKTAPIHVAEWGTWVRCGVKGGSAAAMLGSEVENRSGAEKTCRVTWKLADFAGKVVGTATSAAVQIPAWGSYTFEGNAPVDSPRLWSCEEPHLYSATATLEVDGAVSDEDVVSFGIRTIRFDPDTGFSLNGKPVKIKGTCNHQDHAGVGSALPDRLQSYRIERLKSMNSNALRTSHNPPTPEFLDAADRLGMMVMCETRMMDASPEGLSQLSRMVRRFRNHPSVIIWSLGNEEPEQGTSRGARIVASMKQLTRELDPTRPVTVAMNDAQGDGVSAVVDVQGFNYNEGRIDEFHKKFPKQPIVGTETASTVSTRGIYKNDPAAGYVSAYDLNTPPWAATAEKWWSFYAQREFLAGGFVWTGFDYRGEPTPYSWPCISSHFGIIDTCGFPKDNYFYYKAWWGQEPVVHLFPHWNWPGQEGQDIEVWVHTNLESVELFLNGKSLGEKQVERYSHAEWKVPYAAGLLEARGSKGGKVVLTAKRETTAAPARLVLTADRSQIAADGEDISVINVEVQDAQGRIVPTANSLIRFKLSGPGKIIGVGNGDPSGHEPDKESEAGWQRSAFNGLCMVIVQSAKQRGLLRMEATADGLQGTSAVVDCKATLLRPALS